MTESFKAIKTTKIKTENPATKTFFFDESIQAKPGQFVMLWLSGVNEKPISISFLEPFGLTIARVGSFTEKLFALKEGQRLWYRGPYGNPFALKGKRVCLVGGGCGCAPLMFLASEARQKKLDVTFIEGVKTKNQFFLLDELKKIGCSVLTATDDGSAGFKGNAVQLFEKEAARKKFDAVYSCGPEKMMFALMQSCLAKRVPAQFSLERYMKCGFGLCGQCDLDGFRVCKDGPVFSSEQLKHNKDFGKFRRDATGKRISL